MNGKLKTFAGAVAEKYGLNTAPRFLGRGSFGEAYLFSGERDVVVKTSFYDLTREYEDLKLLHKFGVKVPETYFFESQNGIYAFGMEYFPGANANRFPARLLSEEKKERFATEMTEEIDKLRKIPFDKTRSENKVAPWREYYREKAEGILIKSREREELQYIVPTMERLYENYDDIFSEEPKISLIHGDLCAENMILDPENGSLVGIIDPLNARFADADYEIFQLFCGNGGRLGLYEKYKLRQENVEKLDKKTLFYALFAEAELFIEEGKLLKSVVRDVIRLGKRRAAEYFTAEPTF